MVREAPSSRIRVALPRGEELARLVEHFGRLGFHLDSLLEPSGIIDGGDPLETGFDFEFMALSPADVGTYVEFGICHAGVLSTHLIGENEFEVWRPFTFNFGSYPLVLAAWQGQNLNTLVSKPVLRPATPIPQFAKEWFTTRGIPAEVVPVVDDASMAVRLGLADCWVDRLTDPEEVVDAGFRVVEAMGDGSGAVMIDGKMEDDASCKQCIVMLDLAKALAERDPELAAAYDL